MPYICVNCRSGPLNSERKGITASRSVETVMGQGLEALADIGDAAVPVLFNIA